MKNKKGFMTVTGNGGIVRKNITESNGKYFGDITLATTRTHNNKDYVSYIRVKVGGNFASYAYKFLNAGDQLIVNGDLISNGSERSEKGFDISIVMIDATTIETGSLTRKTQELLNAYRLEKEAQNQQAATKQAHNYAPQQSAPQQAHNYAPQQSAPQQAHNYAPQQANYAPEMDEGWDDDIPF